MSTATLPASAPKAFAMSRSRLKTGYFIIEALNSFVATHFLYYIFFLARDQYGFTNRGNLFLTAVHGFVYIFASWQGGRFAQRFGYFNALKLGCVGMAIGLVLGLILPGVAGQVIALAVWTLPLCLMWPTLEALISEGENFRGTARMVGIYNLVWSSASALAFCSGGWLWEKFGKNGLYLLPLGLVLIQFALIPWLERWSKILPGVRKTADPNSGHPPERSPRQPPLPPKRFLQMAWLANPFAYVAINTVGAVIPQLAHKFDLSAAQSGVFNSLWFYVRFGAFILFWKWTGWHYRFRWLLAAFCGLVTGFATMLLAPQLWLVVLAQVIFGSSIGLIYYSSLFYSMDAGDTKGEHGGVHEAAIGLGIFVGPAIGATALTLLPNIPNAGILAVSGLLLAGLTGLTGLIILRLKK